MTAGGVGVHDMEVTLWEHMVAGSKGTGWDQLVASSAWTPLAAVSQVGSQPHRGAGRPSSLAFSLNSKCKEVACCPPFCPLLIGVHLTPLLGVHTTDFKAETQTNTWTLMFTAAKRWEPHDCPFTEEWITKCGLYTQRDITQPSNGRQFWPVLYTDEPWRQNAKWNKRHKMANTGWFCLYEVPRVGKFIETEGRMGVPGAGRRGKEEWVTNGYSFYLGK